MRMRKLSPKCATDVRRSRCPFWKKPRNALEKYFVGIQSGFLDFSIPFSLLRDFQRASNMKPGLPVLQERGTRRSTSVYGNGNRVN